MEHRSQLLQGMSSTERTQLFNLPSRQFASSISFVRAHSSMLSFIIRVFLSCSPGKIIKSIIYRVSVEMPGFTFWRARSLKSLKDQSMDRFREVLAILSKRDLLIRCSSLCDNGGSSSLKYSAYFFPYFSQLIDKISWEANAWFHNMMLSRRTVYGNAVCALDEA